ncbi:Mis18-beta [Pelobates cultripes]|uniref:Mis18-beta n=1 Tax=Pelobates cultripes TaxID=61616 RepID=A0AAD1WT63_PELCU|nr:Mis18-beta [Pelobates cultripes]
MEYQEITNHPAESSTKQLSLDMVFLCKSCNTVLGDSHSFCGTHDRLQVIIFPRVTDNVIVETGLLLFMDGDMNGCAYYLLLCKNCKTSLGFSLYTASRAFACLRGLFCLEKEKLICYILKSTKICPGSHLNIKQLPLTGHIMKLKKELVNLHVQIELLSSQLEESEKAREKSSEPLPSSWEKNATLEAVK